jgi:hypothetical protein
MSRITCVTFILIMIAPLACKAESLGERILSGLSLQELRMSLQERENRKAALVNPNPWPCFAQSCSVLCAAGRNDIEFLPPYPAAVEPNLTAARRILPILGFSWAPETSVDQGRFILALLMQSAELNQALECHNGQCTVAVHTIEGPNRQAVAVCKASTSDKQLGPPNQCEAVAVRNGPEWWIKIVDFVEQPPYENKRKRISQLEVSGLSRPSILARIGDALSDSPLVMPDRSVQDDRVVALAPRRFSRVISGGWFEWAQVSVKLDEEFRVEVSWDLLVNEQNAANPADWDLPTHQQEAEYRNAIVETVTRALAPICVQPVWKDSDVLRCTKLRTMDGAMIEIPEGASNGRNFKKKFDLSVKRK